jgi:hypothetical protein
MAAGGLTAADPYGDFQTPDPLASAVWNAMDLAGVGLFVEPTVGLGSFLATTPPRVRETPWLAWDINPAYVARTRAIADDLGLDARVQTSTGTVTGIRGTRLGFSFGALSGLAF